MKANNKELFLPLIFTWLNVVIIVNFVSAGTIKGKLRAERGVGRLEYTVIFIEKVEGKQYQPPDKHAVMDQKGKVFVPHILPILVGTTVDFKNSDSLKHNIFTPNKIADRFNLGTYGENAVRSYTFKKPGVVVILCNIHAEMEAYILVLENPYFTRADKRGQFLISDIPAGEYQLRAWHKNTSDESLKVKVPEAGEAEVTLVLKRK